MRRRIKMRKRNSREYLSKINTAVEMIQLLERTPDKREVGGSSPLKPRPLKKLIG